MHVLWDPYAAGLLYGAHWGTPPDREPNQAVDHYERPKKKLNCAKELLQDTSAQFLQLKELGQTTVRFGGDQAIVDKLETLSVRFNSEVGMSRQVLFEYRAQIRDLAEELAQMRRGIFRQMLRGTSKDTQALLQALAIVQALYEHDLEYAATKMANTKPSETALSEREILLRIDPVMLKEFASAEICEAMTSDARSEFDLFMRFRRNPVANEQNLDKDRLASQVLVGKRYYNLNDRYLPVLERLLAFLDEYGVHTISRSGMNRRILESLFKSQLDLMCAFNVVQKVKSCQLTDFVKIGEHHYRFHDEGLCVLKEIMKVKDAL